MDAKEESITDITSHDTLVATPISKVELELSQPEEDQRDLSDVEPKILTGYKKNALEKLLEHLLSQLERYLEYKL